MSEVQSFTWGWNLLEYLNWGLLASICGLGLGVLAGVFPRRLLDREFHIWGWVGWRVFFVFAATVATIVGIESYIRDGLSWRSLINLSVAFWLFALLIAVYAEVDFEKRFKLVVAAASIYMTVAGAAKYLYQQESEALTLHRAEILSICNDATSAAARFAAAYDEGFTPDNAQAAAAARDFIAIYAGKVGLIEDEDVSSAMTAYYKKASYYKWGETVPPTVEGGLTWRSNLKSGAGSIQAACKKAKEINGKVLQLQIK
jgi:hypothetical protein